MINRLIIAIVSILMMASCDCLVSHRGFVLDSRTEKPIEGAIIKFDKREFKTDTLGYFDIHYITGFCPNKNFHVEKENYKSEKLTIDLEDDEVVYRVKSDNDNTYYQEKNSLDFKVKNDTIYFYLTKMGTN